MPRLRETIEEDALYYGAKECYHTRYTYRAYWVYEGGDRVLVYTYRLGGLVKTKLL